MLNHKLCILGDCDLMTAMKRLDEGGHGVLFILDAQSKMIGLLTDGDLRKALRGVQLSAPLSAAMNTKFAYGKAGQSREASINQLKKIKRTQLPLLAEDGTLADIVLLDEELFVRSETPVILMAGGLGSRLGDLTKDTPKPMLEVGHKPILENILNAFVGHGFYRFYFAVNYKSHVIEDYFGAGNKWGVNIEYLREQQFLGTAGALSLLPEKPKQPLIVMNGDVLTEINFQSLLAFHTEHKAKATMAVRKYGVQIPYGTVELDDFTISRLVEKPVHEFYVNAGIYVLDPSCLELIPKDTPFDMPALFETLLKRGEKPASFLIHEYWKDIGQIHDLMQAQQDVLR